MPTIAEPERPVRQFVGCRPSFSDIAGELTDAGVRVTALSVLARAFDIGLDEASAVALAAQVPGPDRLDRKRQASLRLGSVS